MSANPLCRGSGFNREFVVQNAREAIEEVLVVVNE